MSFVSEDAWETLRLAALQKKKKTSEKEELNSGEIEKQILASRNLFIGNGSNQKPLLLEDV